MVEKHELNSTCASSLPAIVEDGKRRKPVFLYSTKPREPEGGYKSIDEEQLASRAFRFVEDDNTFIEVHSLPRPSHGVKQSVRSLSYAESHRSLPPAYSDSSLFRNGNGRRSSSHQTQTALRTSRSLDINNLPSATKYTDKSEKLTTRPHGLSSSASTDESQRFSSHYSHKFQDNKSCYASTEKNSTPRLSTSQFSVVRRPDLNISKRPKPAMEDIMSSLLFSAKLPSGNQRGSKQKDVLRNDVYLVLANLNGRAQVGLRKTETGLEIMAGRKGSQRPMDEHSTTFSQARVRDWVDNQRSLLQKSRLPEAVR